MRFSLFVILSLWVSLNGGDADNSIPFDVYIDPMLPNIFKDLGDSTVLACSVSTSASETPTMKWLFNDVEITETSPAARVHVQTARDKSVLLIYNVEDNDKGKYECVASLGGQTDSKRIFLEIVIPIEFRSSENQHGVSGTEGSIMCEVTGNPPPRTSWRREDNTRIRNSDRYTIIDDRLVIKDLRCEDAGKYICDAIVRNTGVSESLAIDFVVTGGDADNPIPFDVNINPRFPNIFKDLGDSTVLACSVSTSASETPTIKWLFNDVEITETSPGARVHVQTARDKSVLLIYNMEDNDKGKYECVASLGCQTDSKWIFLETFTPMEFRSSENQHGVSGTDGSIMCEVTGNPPPKTSWRREDNTRIRNSDRYIIMEDRLVIKDLQFQDTGKYVCYAIVPTSGVLKTLVIDFVVNEISDPPVMAYPPVIAAAFPTAGDNVTIHCNAEGTPPPTYTFTKDGYQIPEDQINATSGILTIEDLKPEDEAVYNCIASNVGGSVETSISLDVKIPPTISKIPEVDNATLGGKLSIECLAQGDPAPWVFWKKAGMETKYLKTQSHIKITTESNSPDDAEIKAVKSTLVFDGVKADDAGSYECTATNIVGTVTDDVKIDVQWCTDQEGLSDELQDFIAAQNRTIGDLETRLESQQKMTTWQKRKLNRLTQKLESYQQKTSTKLNALTQKLESFEDERTKALSDASNTYAFSAAHVQTDQVKVDKMATMMFSEVLFNIGDAYNATSGVFTAPRKGVYMFHLSVRGNFQRGEILLQLQGDDGEKKIVLAGQGLALEDDEASFNVGVVLQEGGWVKPTLQPVRGRKELTCCRNSVFTGFLLNAL